MVDYSCAIKLATPISVISAMKEAAARKIMIKGGKLSLIHIYHHECHRGI